mmetsp:Transcript_77178/g.153005  ORF Transcript_77178/g.153005 Transcript_77178/m.153005 type:complete len:204 (-) Transcript_77178:1365-1976(-)
MSTLRSSDTKVPDTVLSAGTLGATCCILARIRLASLPAWAMTLRTSWSVSSCPRSSSSSKIRLTRCDTEKTFFCGCCTTSGCPSLHFARIFAPSTSLEVMRRRPLIESTPQRILGADNVSWLLVQRSLSSVAGTARWTSSYGAVSATLPVMSGSYCRSSQAPLLRPPMKDNNTAPPPLSTKSISLEIRLSDGVHGAKTNAAST